MLEYDNDPTKAMRDQEKEKKQSVSQLRDQEKDKKQSLSVRQLVNNGYVGQTLRTIQIGIKSTYEWIGEDLLIMNEPNSDSFEYTAVALTKCVTYAISFADLFKIPQAIRD